MATELPPKDRRHCFFRFSTAISRIWGFVTVVVLWVCATEMLGNSKGHVYIHWYLLGASILMTFLEATWIINKSACCRKEGVCCACWTIVVWVDDWKKSILYIALSIPCFLSDISLYGIISGVVLLVCAVIYFLKSFQNCKCVVRREKQMQYVQIKSTSLTRNLVQHEIQSDASEYAPAGQPPIDVPQSRALQTHTSQYMPAGQPPIVMSQSHMPQTDSGGVNQESNLHNGFYQEEMDTQQ